MELDRNGIEVLDERECRALLADQAIGRVGITVGALPVILPVNYALLDGDVVFRTSAGAKLGAALDHAVVCFEIDGHDNATHEGWSVLVTGRAELIEDPEELAAADLLPLEPWSNVVSGFPVRIRSQMVSGRRIGLPTRAVKEGLLVAPNGSNGSTSSNGHALTSSGVADGSAPRRS